MKVLGKILSLVITGMLVSACASKPVAESSTSDINYKTENDDLPKSEIISEDKEPTPEEIFIFGLNDVAIKFTSTPKIANINRDFSSAYTFTVTKDGTPVSDYPVTISYPSAKNETISYSTINVVTAEDGSYSFTPDKPVFAASTKLTVYPTPIDDSENLLNAALEHKAQADWKVKSDVINKGAVLFIWDFNEKNRPINNSYDVLSEFRTRGMTMVGNAPINETSYIGKPLNTLYKENYEIIEDAYGYLICGTIKFTKPVEACDDGYLCSLIAEIQAVNMKNGKKVFESTFTHEATGANWNKCVTKCKEELAEEIVDALVYGL